MCEHGQRNCLFRLQRGIHSYLNQQVHLIVCWPLYKRIRKECHWRVRYLTRLGSGLYGGGGLQWEADTIVWLLWPPFISPLACMWWLSMFEPVRKGKAINKSKISRNSTRMALTGSLGADIFWPEFHGTNLLEIETYPCELWRKGQWGVVGAAAPSAGWLRVVCWGLHGHEACSCWTVGSKRRGMLYDP